jgi:hypothetical protein
VALVLTSAIVSCHEVSSDPSQEQESKHVLGVTANYDTSPSLKNSEPLTSGEKFKIASKDSFDPEPS